MGAIGEEQCGFLLGVGWGGQHGVMADGVEAKHHFGAGWFFDTQALRADGHAAIGADVDEGAHAPDISPPRATRGRAAERSVFPFWPDPRPVAGSGAVRDGLRGRCDAPAGRRYADWRRRFR